MGIIRAILPMTLPAGRFSTTENGFGFRKVSSVALSSFRTFGPGTVGLNG